VVLAAKSELSYYAYALPDLSAMGGVADRLKQLRDQELIWGPSRHGPGNNHFMYFHDNDGAMIELCFELAQMLPEGDYLARKWPIDPTMLNQWGGLPPLKFILTGFPIVPPDDGRPSWAMRPECTVAATA